mgnify:CR=1 FL=1
MWFQDILVVLIVSSLWGFCIWYLSHGELYEDEEE